MPQDLSKFGVIVVICRKHYLANLVKYFPSLFCSGLFFLGLFIGSFDQLVTVFSSVTTIIIVSLFHYCLREKALIQDFEIAEFCSLMFFFFFFLQQSSPKPRWTVHWVWIRTCSHIKQQLR